MKFKMRLVNLLPILPKQKGQISMTFDLILYYMFKFNQSPNLIHDCALFGTCSSACSVEFAFIVLYLFDFVVVVIMLTYRLPLLLFLHEFLNLSHLISQFIRINVSAIFSIAEAI